MNEQANPKRKIAGYNSRLTGAIFEKMVDSSLRWYAQNELAFVQKTPEPMKPIRTLGNGRFVACYTKQGQPDYKGTRRGGQAIVFDAKHTDNDKIEQSRVAEEQWEELERHHRLGAEAFILVSFGLKDIYKVPWTDWRDMKQQTGKKHLKQSEMEKYRVNIENMVMKFL